jgi:D-aspartate ligase
MFGCGSHRTWPPKCLVVRAVKPIAPEPDRDVAVGSGPEPPRSHPVTSPPVLLADATWAGTLAAVRDLGARGVPVIVAYDTLTAPARWSRYATSVVRCPPAKDAAQFLEWLHAFGDERPGCVLCPTSDDVALLVATHLESLAARFRLFSPTRHALLGMLDKGQLAAAASRAGLKTPATWSPRDEVELRELIDELPLPLLMKPRTQALSRMPGKTRIIHRRDDIVPTWQSIREANVHQPAITGIPDIDLPVLQAYHPASEQVYTVDGFADSTGRVVAAGACLKVLQFPRRSGPGLCFESAPLDDELRGGLERLCQASGYRGVFDAEFLISGEDKLLIDVNPRFYNHMAFELDRSLPLAWLAYLAAAGDEVALRDAIAALPNSDAASGRVYVHRFPALVQLTAQLLTGRMTREEARRWWGWVARSEGITDPAYAHGDPLPALVDVAQWLRHPRSFLRKAAAG